jgi:hypothetical protein
LSLSAQPPASRALRWAWFLQFQILLVFALLFAALIAILALAFLAARGPQPGTVFVQLPASTGPAISMLGQDGQDHAVSGCADGTLGLPGHIDNHIHISGVKNLPDLGVVDITYPGARWHDPCEGGLGWQIVVIRSGQDQLDLYFESATPQSTEVTYTLTLQYQDGITEVLTVRGTSGAW